MVGGAALNRSAHSAGSVATVAAGPRWPLLLAVCLGTVLAPLTLVMLNIALPSIGADLGVPVAALSWVPIGLLLGSVICSLPAGRLADLHGQKHFFLAGVGGIALFCVLAAFSRSPAWLYGCAAGLGVAAAMVYGPGLAIIATAYSPARRGAVTGIYTASIYGVGALAPVLCGWVMQAWGWRTLFWIQLPAALLVAVLLGRVPGAFRKREQHPFDWTGSVIFACWACALVYGLTGLPSLAATVTLLLSLPYLALFIYHQDRIAYPLIRPSLLYANRRLTLALLAGVLVYVSITPIGFLFSLFSQLALDYSPQRTGYLLMVLPGVLVFLAPFAGRLSDRFGSRRLTLAGCLTMAAGYLLLSAISAKNGLVLLVLGQLVLGVGTGLFTTPNMNGIMSLVTPGNLGMASATVGLARAIGNVFGMSLLGLLLGLLLGQREFGLGDVAQLERAVRYWMYFAAAAAGLAAYCAFRQRPLRTAGG